MHAKNAPEKRRRDASASGKGFSGDALRPVEGVRGATIAPSPSRRSSPWRRCCPKLRRRPPLVLGVGYRKIPNVRLPAERATSSLLRSKGGWSVCAKAARHERHGRGSASSFSKSAMRYLGKVVAFQRKISSRWFARDATGFRIAIGMRWIRSARRRNQRRR